MMKINIIGRGNVASHLYLALRDNAEVTMVNPHTLEDFKPDSDVTLVSVSDSVIESVADKLSGYKGIIAHTSGSIDISVFKDKFNKYGVFYPLQTFTKGKPLDYSKIPVFIEGSLPKVADVLKELAFLFTDNVYDADSEKRRVLHVASVFACNFANRLWTLSDEYLKEHDLDYTVLLPLINETVEKISHISPALAQTGPASRGDSNVVSKHLDMLSGHPEMKNIYGIMSESIMNSKK